MAQAPGKRGNKSVVAGDDTSTVTQGEGDIVDQAINAIDAIEKPKNEWVSATRPNLRFKLKPVSSYLVREAGKKFIQPKPPLWMNPEKEREEPNEADPDYVEAMAIFGRNVGEVTQRLFLGYGSEPLELPSDVEPLDSDAWIEDIEAVTEIEVPRTGKSRYIAWLRLYVLQDDDERLSLNQEIMRFNGIILEVDVQTATTEFKSDEAQQPNTDSAPETAPA